MALRCDVGVGGEWCDHQERQFPDRVIGTSFVNPDFELIGRAFGFNVTRISANEDLRCLPEILARSGPELVVVATSIKAVLPERPPAGQTARA